MWLVQSFWKLCGLFNIDLTYNKFQNMYSVFLIITCVYNFITASNALCKLDHWCDVFSTAMIGMYTRVLASTTLLSRITIMVQSKESLLKYKETIKAFEIYSPTSSTQYKNYKIFSFTVVFVCLSIILPINISRLYYLYQNESSDISLFIYYLFIYIQNLSMCCIETQFVTQCFIIYTRFRGINDDLKKLRDENVNYAKYPFILSSSATMWKDYKKSFQCVRYDKDFYRPRLISHPMANAVEILRIKHWLTRQAVDILNNLLGIQMGLSVFLLWVMALFDIYYEIFHNSPSKLLVYGWLFQYSLRLFMIILVAHYTTKQAIKSKSIILDTNNQMLDNSTKEELLLFVNQISHQSIEFTACDFFTLNTQIIKSIYWRKLSLTNFGNNPAIFNKLSTATNLLDIFHIIYVCYGCTSITLYAIAAGTTYLVILVQFHS